MTRKKYLYLLAIPYQWDNLASAESVSLTGAAPNEFGITVSDSCVDTRRGAFIKSCMEVYFETSRVAELYSIIQNADLHAEEFRVSVVKRPRSLKIGSMAMARKIGSMVAGKPNLSAPKVVFLTVMTAEKIWFGRLISEADGKWVDFNQRPHVTSSSLPARLALALVNIISSPGESLLDPCCGTGTIVMSAAQYGMKASGYDINPRMVGATTKNLKHFELHANVQLKDARTIQNKFDTIATDLPYGISLVKDSDATDDILLNLRTLAPKAGFIDIRDINQQLTDKGYNVDMIIPVPKLQLIRRVFITSNGDQ